MLVSTIISLKRSCPWQQPVDCVLENGQQANVTSFSDQPAAIFRETVSYITAIIRPLNRENSFPKADELIREGGESIMRIHRLCASA